MQVLGSEDNGLPRDVVQACHSRVTIPTVRGDSFNVAVAGSMVMYDRCRAVYVPSPLVFFLG